MIFKYFHYFLISLAAAGAGLLRAGAEVPEVPSFRHDVLPVLAKAGCNTGGCHGAIAGKGGFRLSLFGYDAEKDYFTITREVRGRRIEMSDPARSLLLTKPTTAVPHKGGLRLEPGSEDYRILTAWISAGAPPPRADDPVVARLTVTPEETELAQIGRASCRERV